jgi:SSS family solute:Na+ symporter
MTTYFTAGGLLTSAWVNLVQLAVLLAGFAVALPLALDAAGGWSGLRDATGAIPEYWNLLEGGRSGWMYLALLGPAFIVSPGLLQKVYGARDDRAVVVGVSLNAVTLLAFAFVPPLLGMIARVLHPDLPNHELALPTVLTHDLPPLVGSLGLAALFSAEVSTADAILFMLATSLSQDLYRGFVRPDATEQDVLRVARWAAVGGGTCGVLLAVVLPSIIGALSVFYSVLSVSLFVPVIVGLIDRRLGAPEALAAICAGIAALGAVSLTASPPLSPVLAGLIAATAAAVLVRMVRRGRAGLEA